MPLNLINIDSKTRNLMVSEINQDIQNSQLYLSKRFNANGQALYPDLLQEAAKNHDDAWLALQLRTKNMFKTEEQKRTPSGKTTTAKVPTNAADTFAEGEFNRFYIRAICLRAIEEGNSRVKVYRAHHRDNPRPESQSKIGEMIDAKKLLSDLRSNPGVDLALGIPSGPNSGLSVQLP